MRYTVFNPFRRVMNETHLYEHTRTIRTSFLTKLGDAMEVFCGNTGFDDGCTHFGIFDYFTLFLPGLLSYSQAALWHANYFSPLRKALGFVVLIFLLPITVPTLILRVLSGLIITALATPIIAIVHFTARHLAKERLEKINKIEYFSIPDFEDLKQRQQPQKAEKGFDYYDVPFPLQAMGRMTIDEAADLKIDIFREPHATAFDQSSAFAVYKTPQNTYNLALRMMRPDGTSGLIPITPENKENVEALLALNVGDVTRRLYARHMRGEDIETHYKRSIPAQGAKPLEYRYSDVSSLEFIRDLMDKRFTITRPNMILTAVTAAPNMKAGNNRPHSWEEEAVLWDDTPPALI